MTKITDIYEGGSHQVRHCDSCEIPQALAAMRDPSYSLIKHLIIESRHAKLIDPGDLALMRLRAEDQGAEGVFDAAQKCIRCAEGLCLLIKGSETNWRVGGSLAIEC